MKTYTKHNTRNTMGKAKWQGLNYFNNIVNIQKQGERK